MLTLHDVGGEGEGGAHKAQHGRLVAHLQCRSRGEEAQWQGRQLGDRQGAALGSAAARGPQQAALIGSQTKRRRLRRRLNAGPQHAPRRAGGAGPLPQRARSPRGSGGSPCPQPAAQGSEEQWGVVRQALRQVLRVGTTHAASTIVATASKAQQQHSSGRGTSGNTRKNVQKRTAMVRMGSAITGPLPAVMSKGMFMPARRSIIKK
jgi:hypothetical protein